MDALYETIASNQVQVSGGTGSGTYNEGQTVTIKANAAPAGYRFKGWNVVTGNVTLANPASETTTFTMPASAVQVRAVYQVMEYTLTVNSGSGGGIYKAGDTVKLTANYPAEGKVFDRWSVTSGSAAVNPADRYYAGVVMPASDLTVAALYKDGPSPAGNAIQNISQGGEYLKGSTISFTAVGNGMGNTNPNPGDYRYRPTGYQIGGVSGGWNNGSYTTSMAINAVGDYTLTVTFTKDIYDGSRWTPTNTVDTKSVTFHVVSAMSVATGDDTPILPIAAAAGASLLAIVLIVVYLVRRRH